MRLLFAISLFVLILLHYGECVRKKVIVVGSGVAGLSAAASLMQKGITDIAVIEARSRVGGRTHTVPYQNGFIEMGAQWVHGSTNNPIYTLAKSLSLLDETTKTYFGDMSYATQDGSTVSETFVDQTRAKIEKLFAAAEKEADSLTQNTDKSLISILDRRFADLLRNSALNASTSELYKAIYTARVLEEKVDTACGNLNELSAIGWNSFSDSGGDNEINLKNGYVGVVDHFRSRVGDRNILLNESVLQIQYPQSSTSTPVKVWTVNTITGAQTMHEADFVLTTMPLGYLKAHYKTLFSPALPTAKANAIERLGFGTVNKYWLVFDSQPLASTGQGFQVLWRNDMNMQVDAAARCGFGNYPFYKAVASFEALPKMKNIFYAFMVGEEAQFTEKVSDECLLDIFHEMLVKAFPKKVIPKPRSIIRSKWNSDGYTKGSYSYIKLGSSTKDIDSLAESINSKVFFGGEATSKKFITTVHGAYESGLREAEKISKLVTKK